jgi:hypothetical protein
MVEFAKEAYDNKKITVFMIQKDNQNNQKYMNFQTTLNETLNDDDSKNLLKQIAEQYGINQDNLLISFENIKKNQTEAIRLKDVMDKNYKLNYFESKGLLVNGIIKIVISRPIEDNVEYMDVQSLLVVRYIYRYIVPISFITVALSLIIIIEILTGKKKNANVSKDKDKDKKDTRIKKGKK